MALFQQVLMPVAHEVCLLFFMSYLFCIEMIVCSMSKVLALTEKYQNWTFYTELTFCSFIMLRMVWP